MTILGMGSIEILVILLVAFIVMGPGRMADAAKLLGKATREVRRLSEGLSEVLMEEDPDRGGERPIVHRGGGAGAYVREPQAGAAETPDPSAQDADDPGPVAFRRPDRGVNGGESPSNGGVGDK
jgi:Sec-independent protein translocase protein TatA